MENKKLKDVMGWLEDLKGYADYILNDDIAIAVNTQNVLVAISSKSGRSVYIPINSSVEDVDIVSAIVDEFGE